MTEGRSDGQRVMLVRVKVWVVGGDSGGVHQCTSGTCVLTVQCVDTYLPCQT